MTPGASELYDRGPHCTDTAAAQSTTDPGPNSRVPLFSADRRPRRRPRRRRQPPTCLRTSFLSLDSIFGRRDGDVDNPTTTTTNDGKTASSSARSSGRFGAKQEYPTPTGRREPRSFLEPDFPFSRKHRSFLAVCHRRHRLQAPDSTPRIPHQHPRTRAAPILSPILFLGRMEKFCVFSRRAISAAGGLPGPTRACRYEGA